MGIEEEDSLRAQVAALEQLLQVYESTSIQQASKLEHALAELDRKGKLLVDAERQRAELALKRADDLKQELEIAKQIQTSILPRVLSVEGLEIAARMIPADEVGGDYYDVISADDGCWIAIGDVSGHGLTAGLIMLMAQGMSAALSRLRPSLEPAQVLTALNLPLFDNIHRRLLKDDFVSLCLLRYYPDGRIVFAGAHEELVIWRASTGLCERVPTPGTWVGAMPDIAKFTSDSTCRLNEGDLLVLYTDGLTEALNSANVQFGMDRVCASIELAPSRPVTEILDRLLADLNDWTPKQADDITILVLRYHAFSRSPARASA